MSNEHDHSTPAAGTEPGQNAAEAPQDRTDVGADDFCRSYLRDHGVSLDYAREVGLKNIPDGWNKKKTRPIIGGLLIPYGGKLFRLRHRRTSINPQEEAGHLIRDGYEIPKFRSPPGANVAPYIPPTRMPDNWGTDTTQPLFFSEGPVKALAMTEHGLPCLGLGGVEAGAHDAAMKRGEGALELHPTLRRLAWAGRMVFIAFDAFRVRTTGVARGEARLACILGRAGAHVFLVELPPDSRMGLDFAAYAEDERDQGPDDYIRRHGVEPFLRLATRFIPADPVERLRACPSPDEARRLLDDLTFQAALHVGGATTVAAVASVLKRQFKLDVGKTAVDQKVREFRTRDARRVAAAAETAGASGILANEYAVHAGCTCQVIHDPKLGRQLKQIANFTASIVREVTLDDGITVNTVFSVTGALATGVSLPTIEVPAAKWCDRTWLAEHWGARAVVEAGRDAWGHLLAAIQKASTPATATIYQHTGWRKVGDRMAFLFPGHSIGATDAEVKSPDDGGRYGFPQAEASAQEVISAVRRSIALMTIGDPQVTVPVAASAYTAPLATILEIDFAVWVAGESGSCKSGLVGLAVSHFGSFSYSALPLSWMSTVNAIENFLCKTKDCLAVVDNYIPGDREGPAKVNRITQQIGDRAGRGRLSKDSAAMPARPPRGLLLATGEDVPIGSSDSTVARLVVVRAKKGDVEVGNVIEASHDGTDYAVAMRAYLAWFASDYEKHSAEARAQRDHLLPQFEASVRDHGVHPRTARSVAALGAGVTAFLAFAVSTGAISEAEHGDIQRLADRALVQVARAQASFRENTTPVQRYMSTLRSLLLQRRVTLAERDADLDSMTGIGWHDGEFVYLDANLAWKAIEDFHAQGQKWPFSKTGMHQALIEAGIIHRAEAGKADAWRTLGSGGRVRVLLVYRAHLADSIPVPVDYTEFGTEDTGDAPGVH